MYSTYACFSKHVSQCDIEKSFETLAFDYQENKSPKLFMAAYVKAFKFLVELTKKERFCKIDSEDKASIILEDLDKCLRNFKGYSNNQPFYHCFLNYLLFQLNFSLSTYSRMITSNKRGGFDKVLSLDQLKEDFNFDISFKADFDEYETNLKLPDNLTSKEFLYCWAVLKGLDDGKVSNTSMANFLEVSNTMIYHLKKRLRDKFIDASICLY